MPRIQLKPDTLDAETDRFAPSPLARPLFMTSLQKSGTHLLRNILRMFIPVDQQYRAYIQAPTLDRHAKAFDPVACLFSFGHLAFSSAAAMRLRGVPKLLLYRDPYDWVLARARFLTSDQFEGELGFLKGGRVEVDDLISLMIVGIPGKLPGLAQSYGSFVTPWLASASVHGLRYEELVAHCRNVESAAAQDYFQTLFRAAGIDCPPDWQDRIIMGSDPARSGTARESLSGAIDLPPELPDAHRRLIDCTVPGLRDFLGYTP